MKSKTATIASTLPDMRHTRSVVPATKTSAIELLYKNFTHIFIVTNTSLKKKLQNEVLNCGRYISLVKRIPQ